MTRTKSTSKRICGLALAVIMAVMSVWALVGCSLFGTIFGSDYVKFTRGNITLQIGDKYNLAEIIESDSSSYTLTSSDSAVVSVDRRTATANAVGVAYITAETRMYSDRIRVTVTDVQPDSLTVSTDGALVQTVGETSPVLFTPTATGSVASRSVDWYVNGELVATLGGGEGFEFQPSAAALYEVTATAGEFSATKTVRCYYQTTAKVTASGEFEQSNTPFASIDFSVDIERDERNPADYIELYENGVCVYSGENTSFVYDPEPGRYTITAVVNGKQVYSAQGWFRGAVTPECPSVAFDNLYPHVYVEHNAVGYAAVEITSPTGSTEIYSQTDTRYSQLFTADGVDVGGLINLCASSNMRRSYTIRVKSLGDGDAYTESEFSEGCTFVQLPSAAKRYVETLCLDSDLYVTSDAEYARILEYYIINRKKAANTSVAFNCYIAYDMDGDEQDLWNDAFQVAATSGIYKSISVSLSNNIMRTSFVVDTVNTPTRQSSDSSGRRNEQLHAIIPHINYDPDKYRSADHVFYPDTRERTASVTYTDELYLAVERGVQPLPTTGSAAAIVYQLARDVLRKICTDDMTDVQKAHAIYDWIIWKVTYDGAAINTDNGESLAAYYLEGVFSDGVTSIGGKVYKPYAVCDGMSKAYSLLCNMEGIPCVRVAGVAGDSLDSAGGHAWNKVYVNDGWYIVDCTWGDATASLDIGGFRNSDYELGLHDYLFLTEAQVAGNHFEPYQAGSSSIIYVPKTTSKPLNIYEQTEFNGVKIDSYVASRQNSTERVREIVAAHARAYKKISAISIPGDAAPSSVTYRGFEIKFEGTIDISNSALKTLISNTVGSVNRNIQVRTYIIGDVVMVLLSSK